MQVAIKTNIAPECDCIKCNNRWKSEGFIFCFLFESTIPISKLNTESVCFNVNEPKFGALNAGLNETRVIHETAWC